MCHLGGGSANFLACNCEAQQPRRGKMRARNSQANLPRRWYETPQGYIKGILANLKTSKYSMKYELVLPHPDLEVIGADGMALYSTDKDRQILREHLTRFVEGNVSCTHHSVCGTQGGSERGRDKGSEKGSDKGSDKGSEKGRGKGTEKGSEKGRKRINRRRGGNQRKGKKRSWNKKFSQS